MGLPWFRVYADMPDHPKSLRLGAVLKDRNAFAYIVRLWAWCARVAPEGRILADQVEAAAQWRGKSGAFLAAALQPMPDGKPGWLEDAGDGWVIAHDWDDEQGSHVAKLERDRKASEDRRVARKSQKVAKKSRDVSATVAISSPDEVALEGEGDREVEKEKRQQPAVAAVPERQLPPVADRITGEQLRELWNQAAAPPSKLPAWEALPPKQREKADEAALAFDRETWARAFEKIRRCAFLNGFGDKGWLLTPGKLLRDADSLVVNVLNGEYDGPNDLPPEARP